MGLVYEQARYPQLLEIYGFVGGRIAGGQELCQFLFYGFFLFFSLAVALLFCLTRAVISFFSRLVLLIRYFFDRGICSKQL